MRVSYVVSGIWKISVKVTIQELALSDSPILAKGWFICLFACLLIAEAQQALCLLSETTLVFICDDDAAHLKRCNSVMCCLLIIIFTLWFNYPSDPDLYSSYLYSAGGFLI